MVEEGGAGCTGGGGLVGGGGGGLKGAYSGGESLLPLLNRSSTAPADPLTLRGAEGQGLE
jgi:hypothetical protein